MAQRALTTATSADEAERAGLALRRLLWLRAVADGTAGMPDTWTPGES